MYLSKIYENLWVGEVAAAHDKMIHGENYVFIDVRDFKEHHDELYRNFKGEHYWMPVFDKNSQPDEKKLDAVSDLIDKLIRQGKTVLVHCGAGMERSPLAVAWYLHKAGGLSIGRAYDLVKEKHPATRRLLGD